jgi:hypothetical protein
VGIRSNAAIAHRGFRGFLEDYSTDAAEDDSDTPPAFEDGMTEVPDENFILDETPDVGGKLSDSYGGGSSKSTPSIFDPYSDGSISVIGDELGPGRKPGGGGGAGRDASTYPSGGGPSLYVAPSGGVVYTPPKPAPTPSASRKACRRVRRSRSVSASSAGSPRSASSSRSGRRRADGRAFLPPFSSRGFRGFLEDYDTDDDGELDPGSVPSSSSSTREPEVLADAGQALRRLRRAEAFGAGSVAHDLRRHVSDADRWRRRARHGRDRDRDRSLPKAQGLVSAVLRLSPAQVAKVRAARGRSDDAQRAIAREIDPSLVKGADGWNWGRKAFDLLLTEDGIDLCPAKVAIVFSLEVSEYMAAKGKKAHGARHLVDRSAPKPAIYRHEHDRTSSRDSLPRRRTTRPPSSRRAARSRVRRVTPPRLTGPGLVVLGQCIAFEGDDRDRRLSAGGTRPVKASSSAAIAAPTTCT